MLSAAQKLFVPLFSCHLDNFAVSFLIIFFVPSSRYLSTRLFSIEHHNSMLLKCKIRRKSFTLLTSQQATAASTIMMFDTCHKFNYHETIKELTLELWSLCSCFPTRSQWANINIFSTLNKARKLKLT